MNILRAGDVLTRTMAASSTFNISDAVRDVLARSTITATSVTLPDGQLERKLYEAVNKALEGAGGKWNRKAKAHIFERDPRELLGLAVETGNATNVRTALQAFYTPPPLASRLVAASGLRPGSRILEPSCGDGSLLLAAADVMGTSGVYDAFDIDPVALTKAQARLNQRLLDNGVPPDRITGCSIFTCCDFLAVEPTKLHGDLRSARDHGRIYDVVLMNPPFTKGQDIAHVMHAWQFVRPGSTLAAIVSTHYQEAGDPASRNFRKLLAAVEADEQDIPRGTFEHTDVATVMVVAHKPS